MLAALAACIKLPALSIFAGAMPLLLLAVCLIPCLVPLAWLRNAILDKTRPAPAPETDVES